jgi:hypothetical protein
MASYRRKLPQLQRDDKRHFHDFCTVHRWILPDTGRAIALQCCLHDNDLKHFLHAAVVMPDHVHLIFTPLVNSGKHETYSLAEIMGAELKVHRHNSSIGNWVTLEACGRQNPSTVCCGLQNRWMLKQLTSSTLLFGQGWFPSRTIMLGHGNDLEPHPYAVGWPADMTHTSH